MYRQFMETQLLDISQERMGEQEITMLPVNSTPADLQPWLGEAAQSPSAAHLLK